MRSAAIGIPVELLISQKSLESPEYSFIANLKPNGLQHYFSDLPTMGKNFSVEFNENSVRN